MPPICRSISSHQFFHRPQERLSIDLSLYLIANRPSFSNENLFFSKIIESVKGGVSCVQLRDHESDFSTILKTASHLKTILKETPLFINTLKSLEVAHAINAEGIFLEEAISYSKARELLGSKKIIGISVKNLKEVLSVNQTHAIDYISVKVSPSKHTCPRNDALWGIEGLRTIRNLSEHPIVGVGGLDLTCVESIYRELHLKNGDGVAMAGGLMREENPYQTAQEIRMIYDKWY